MNLRDLTIWDMQPSVNGLELLKYSYCNWRTVFYSQSKILLKKLTLEIMDMSMLKVIIEKDS